MEKQEASLYRLPAEQATQIRTNPPVNMSILEAAEYLGISPRKLRALVSARRVKHARIGARIILRREYLDELVKVGT